MNAMQQALNKLTKWRAVFAGWQLGSRHNDDPECQAVRHQAELSMVLRVEMTAVTRLLIEKGVFTLTEYDKVIIEEAGFLEKAYEKKFPGFSADPNGIIVDVDKAKETTKGWRK